MSSVHLRGGWTKRTCWTIGVVYRTFASWLGTGDRAEHGLTASLAFGFLLASVLFLFASAFRPMLIHDWLALPSFVRLVVPALVVSLPSLVLETKKRGWRWAEEAQVGAPLLNSYARLITGMVCFFAIACWFAAFYLL